MQKIILTLFVLIFLGLLGNLLDKIKNAITLCRNLDLYSDRKSCNGCRYLVMEQNNSCRTCHNRNNYLSEKAAK